MGPASYSSSSYFILSWMITVGLCCKNTTSMDRNSVISAIRQFYRTYSRCETGNSQFHQIPQANEELTDKNPIGYECGG